MTVANSMTAMNTQARHQCQVPAIENSVQPKMIRFQTMAMMSLRTNTGATGLSVRVTKRDLS